MIRVELSYRNLLVLLGLLLLAWIGWLLRSTILLIVIALMLMATLNPLVKRLERHGLSHGKAVGLVMLGLFLVPVIVILALAPAVIAETRDFAASLPDLQHRINSLLLGIVAAIGDIIPIFGVWVAMAVAMLVALTQSMWQPVAVMIGNIIYSEAETHYLVPKIYARTVNISPLGVVVATLAGAALDGFIGILLAIPVAGVLKVVVDYIGAERRGGHAAAQTVMEAEPTDLIGKRKDEPLQAL